MEQFKYFAFISYNSKDTAWGKKLQKKLEHYRLPASLCHEHGWDRKPIKPVFFAPTDIQPGGLNEELQERLKNSKNLIVICSPNSAKSEWVGKEIEFFHSLGRTKSIHFFIVDGIPNSGNPETECFNPVVEKLGLPEILGANIHEGIYRWSWLNRERAYAQLISKLLGVEFDTLWKRHKKRLIQKVLAWTIGSIIMIAAWVFTIRMIMPVTVEIHTHDISKNEFLPYENGIVTLHLDNETLTDTVCLQVGKAHFNRIPRYRMGNDAHIQVTFRDFFEKDTVMPLAELITLDIERDPRVFGHIHFSLWDLENENFVPDCEIVISDRDSNGQTRIITYGKTDSRGCFETDIPLPQQRTAYNVSSPNVNLESNTLYMPCGENDVILTKH